MVDKSRRQHSVAQARGCQWPRRSGSVPLSVHGPTIDSADKLCVAMRLVLIRHAPVETEPEIPTEQWPLSTAGVRAASALRRSSALGSVSVFASSPEPKASATAVAIANGRPIVEMTGLKELDPIC